MGLTILKIVLIVIGVAGLGIAGIAFGSLRFVRANNEKKKAASQKQMSDGPENIGVCSRCGKNRIIVSVADNMCATCYSSLRTKKD